MLLKDFTEDLKEFKIKEIERKAEMERRRIQFEADMERRKVEMERKILIEKFDYFRETCPPARYADIDVNHISLGEQVEHDGTVFYPVIYKDPTEFRKMNLRFISRISPYTVRRNYEGFMVELFEERTRAFLSRLNQHLENLCGGSVYSSVILMIGKDFKCERNENVTFPGKALLMDKEENQLQFDELLKHDKIKALIEIPYVTQDSSGTLLVRMQIVHALIE